MSKYSHVTDEMLSAYLDNAVTASERSLVETAVADDPDIAWRLATLQHTVNLLGRLPDIALPRSFALTEAMIAEPVAETAGVGMPTTVSPPKPEKAGFWEAWRPFWQGGNIFMRNAAAASFAAFLVLAAGGMVISTQSAGQNQQADIMPASDAMMRQPVGNLSAPDPQERRTFPARESAQTEPIPLPASAASEVGAVALAVDGEHMTSPLIEHTLAASAPTGQSDAAAPPSVAEEVTIEEMSIEDTAVEEVVRTEPEIAATGVDAESEPITAAAMTMAAAPLAEGNAPPEADTKTIVVEDDSEPDAAPEAMTATTSANDETNATSMTTDSSQAATTVESQAMEEPVQESAAVTTLSKTPVDTNTDASPAAINSDNRATSPVEDETIAGAELVAEDAPTETAAMRTEAAPAETVELAGPPLGVQQVPMTASASATNITQSDPILFVQTIALALTLLFLALWLLSRRAKPTAH